MKAMYLITGIIIDSLSILVRFYKRAYRFIVTFPGTSLLSLVIEVLESTAGTVQYRYLNNRTRILLIANNLHRIAKQLFVW